MSGYTYFHIEVHLCKDSEKNKQNQETFVAYEIEDNDTEVLFSPHLFHESIQDWKNDENEEFDAVRQYTPQHLHYRFQLMKQSIYGLEKKYSTICFKIKRLIDFIAKHKDNYVGIRIIY